MTMKPRLLYISTLPCEPTAGGPIQMHRHFIENKDFDFKVVVEPSSRNLQYLETGSHLINSCLYRGSKTRFFPHLLALNYLMAERRDSDKLLALAHAFRPQAIVTVAYGSYSFVAASIARRMKLPLITFFHDWWPDLTLCQGWSKRWLDYCFRRLYRESSLALCVCESMYQELGKHSHATVLYPIPALNVSSQVPSPMAISGNKQFQVVYLGTLEGDYGQLVQTLVRTLEKHSAPRNFQMKLYGPAADWPSETLEFAKSAGVYGGQRYGVDAQSVLSQADAFLVVMGFSEAKRRRVRTSFPSKILEYAAYGKPIIVWGPEDCSAVQFLKAHHAGAVITSPDPTDLITCLSRLANDVAWQVQLSQAAHQLSVSLFNPQMIHQQFLKLVKQVLQG